MYGNTILYLSARTGRTELVQNLLDAGANPNIATVHGRTPLAEAVAIEDKAMIKRLLDKGADPNIKYTQGNVGGFSTSTYPILFTATDIDIITMLLEAGADPRARVQIRQDPDEPLIAFTFGKPSKALLLRNAGARADEREGDGTPVIFRINRLAELQFAHTQLGADLMARDAEGNTILHILAKEPDTADIIQYVLANGGTLELNNKLYTPLHVVHPENTAAIDAFVAAGVDVNAIDHDGDTAFHHTPELIAFFVGRGYRFDPTPINSRGNTLLHIAAGMDSHETTATVLDFAGIDVNATNNEGDTALHIAMKTNPRTAALISNARGVRIDALDAQGKPAIAYSRGPGFLSLFMARGAGVDFWMRDGMTFLQWLLRERYIDAALVALPMDHITREITVPPDLSIEATAGLVEALKLNTQIHTINVDLQMPSPSPLVNADFGRAYGEERDRIYYARLAFSEAQRDIQERRELWKDLARHRADTFFANPNLVAPILWLGGGFARDQEMIDLKTRLRATLNDSADLSLVRAARFATAKPGVVGAASMGLEEEIEISNI